MRAVRNLLVRIRQVQRAGRRGEDLLEFGNRFRRSLMVLEDQPAAIGLASGGATASCRDDCQART